MTQLYVQSQYLLAMLQSLLDREEGQDGLEYAVVAAVVVAAVVAAYAGFSGQLTTQITSVFAKIAAAIGSIA